MEIALDLARSRQGLTGTNPSVGCVIVKNNNIISIGQTSYNGRPHAEFNAIKNCNEKLSGAKMYVTLEPCNHQGVTPPCTNEIIKSEISEASIKLLSAVGTGSCQINSSLGTSGPKYLEIGPISLCVNLNHALVKESAMYL